MAWPLWIAVFGVWPWILPADIYFGLMVLRDMRRHLRVGPGPGWPLRFWRLERTHSIKIWDFALNQLLAVVFLRYCGQNIFELGLIPCSTLSCGFRPAVINALPTCLQSFAGYLGTHVLPILVTCLVVLRIARSTKDSNLFAYDLGHFTTLICLAYWFISTETSDAGRQVIQEGLETEPPDDWRGAIFARAMIITLRILRVGCPKRLAFFCLCLALQALGLL